MQTCVSLGLMLTGITLGQWLMAKGSIMLRFVSGFVMGMVAGITLAGFAAGVFGRLPKRMVCDQQGWCRSLQ
jgi:hypothetical protein